MQPHASDKAENGVIPRVPRRPVAKALLHYQTKHKAHDEVMCQAYASGDYSMQAIALHFGVYYSTVSRVIQKISAVDD